ncbi:MAG: YhcH/YjgK/YiaL family protein, partial [Clostridia bacterium]|nr:YhcH/YjgK/YiaL family protein [Clostridia bacterium]
MIIDSLKNAKKYFSVHPSFEKAFEALAAIDDSTPNERITVDGDNIFINLGEYTNKNVNDCPFESHKKYIDIQYMVWGEEYIDVCDQDSLEFTDNRLDTDDIAFFKGT